MRKHCSAFCVLWTTVFLANICRRVHFRVCRQFDTDIFNRGRQTDISRTSGAKRRKETWTDDLSAGDFRRLADRADGLAASGGRTARVWVIIIMTYLVALGGYAHIIAGSVEVSYAVMTGAFELVDFLSRLDAPDACSETSSAAYRSSPFWHTHKSSMKRRQEKGMNRILTGTMFA